MDSYNNLTSCIIKLLNFDPVQESWQLELMGTGYTKNALFIHK